MKNNMTANDIIVRNNIAIDEKEKKYNIKAAYDLASELETRDKRAAFIEPAVWLLISFVLITILIKNSTNDMFKGQGDILFYGLMVKSMTIAVIIGMAISRLYSSIAEKKVLKKYSILQKHSAFSYSYLEKELKTINQIVEATNNIAYIDFAKKTIQIEALASDGSVMKKKYEYNKVLYKDVDSVTADFFLDNSNPWLEVNVILTLPKKNFYDKNTI